jgi:hypothetical protein
MFWKLTGNDDDLSLYIEADTEEDAKEKADAICGYLKPQHITIEAISQDEIPEEENVL